MPTKRVRKLSPLRRKQYVGISRDHSGSMQSLSHSAMKDYNENIEVIKEAAKENKIDTFVSVVKCGIGIGLVAREQENVLIESVSPITTYKTEGGTPLFDSIGELITILSRTPDAEDANVSFLIMAITDGQENQSKFWNAQSLGKEIKRLQATDKWTFTFRVPSGYAKALVSMGIPSGNVVEWEQTEEGMRGATVQTVRAVKSYYVNVSHGVAASSSFYSDLSGVKTKDIKAVMTNISKEVVIWPVKTGGLEIKEFVEKKLRRGMAVGAAFYQLTKPERKVQEYKMLIIRDKRNGSVYAGKSARDLLSLPDVGTIRLAPGDHGNYDIYIQSTSTNRKLIANTNVLYWTGAVVARAAIA